MPAKKPPSGRQKKTARFQMLMAPSVKEELKRAASKAGQTGESLNDYLINAGLMRARGTFQK